jgi:DNA polymerase III subunit alpha
LELPVLPDVPAPDRSDILKMEKETMGIYISDHPLRGYEFSLKNSGSHSISQVLEMENPQRVSVAGVLSQVQIRPSQRTGSLVARITLEDFSGQIGGFAFGDTVSKLSGVLEKDKVVVVSGRVKFDERSQATERTPEIQIFEVHELPAPVIVDMDDSVEGRIMISIKAAKVSQLQRLRNLVEQTPGDYEVLIQFINAADAMPIVLLNRVTPTDEFLRGIRRNLDDAEIEIISASGDPVSSVAEDPTSGQKHALVR